MKPEVQRARLRPGYLLAGWIATTLAGTGVLTLIGGLAGAAIGRAGAAHVDDVAPVVMLHEPDWSPHEVFYAEGSVLLGDGAPDAFYADGDVTIVGDLYVAGKVIHGPRRSTP